MERIERSESIREIAMALSKFQGEVQNPKSISTNPNFNSRYAPLSEVINTIKESLMKASKEYDPYEYMQIIE